MFKLCTPKFHTHRCSQASKFGFVRMFLKDCHLSGQDSELVSIQPVTELVTKGAFECEIL